MPHVEIPSWDDIVHITPRYQYSEAEKAEFRKPANERIWSNVSREGLDEYAKRCDYVRKKMKSNIPEIVNKIGSIMTMIDDIEDGLTTAAVGGRLACKVAPKMLGKWIPYVGWAFRAADILNVFNMLSFIPLSPRGGKKRMYDLAESNPLSKKSKAHAAAKARAAQHGKSYAKMAKKLPVLKKLGPIIPSMGEMLEIAQTTDNLFGVGLCLGPIVGMVLEGVFGFQDRLSNFQKRTADAFKEKKYSKTLMYNPIIAGLGEELGEETFERTVVSESLVLDKITKPFEYYTWGEYEEGLNEVSMVVPTPENVVTIAALEDNGIDWRDAIGFPYADDPKELYPCELHYRTHEKTTGYLQAYCERNTNNYQGYVIGTTASKTCDKMVGFYEGRMWEEQTTTIDEARLAQICLESEILPPEGATDQSREEFWEEAVTYGDINGKLPRGQELKAIAIKHFGEIGTFPSGELTEEAKRIFPEFDSLTATEKERMKSWGLQFE